MRVETGVIGDALERWREGEDHANGEGRSDANLSSRRERDFWRRRERLQTRDEAWRGQREM